MIADNFASRPTLRGIPMRYINRVTELLPTSLPLEVTGPLIDDEGYWKRCALQRWDNCQIVDHGSSWKRLYFERNLTDFLEVRPARCDGCGPTAADPHARRSASANSLRAYPSSMGAPRRVPPPANWAGAMDWAGPQWMAAIS